MFISINPPPPDQNQLQQVDERQMPLAKAFQSMLSSSEDVTLLGSNPIVLELAAGLGLDHSSFCSFDVLAGGTRSCLICVPDRIWYADDAKTALLKVKDALASSGIPTVFVREAFVRDPLQEHVVGRRSRALECGVGRKDRIRMLANLLEHGSRTVLQLACLLDHATPFDAVLHFVGLGALEADLEQPISLSSSVELASPAVTA